MTGIEWPALLPLLYLAGCTILILLLISIRVSEKILRPLVGLFLAGGFVTLKLVPAKALGPVTDLLAIDSYSLFCFGLFLAGALAVFGLSVKSLHDHGVRPQAFYLLLFLAVIGASVLASSRHFVSFFLGLEILSVPLYVMIAYPRDRNRPLESGIKYLILAGVASAFLLFGIALVYAARGTLGFAAEAGGGPAASSTPLLLAGFSLLAVGFGFKLALVPFHFWAPDVYQGAPAPVAGFLATVSKAGVLAFLLRFSHESHLVDIPAIKLLFGAMAVASMFAGSWLALLQRNVKRILAYSSIAHFGYVLVAFLAAGEAGTEAALFYLTVYVAMTLGAFGVVTALSGEAGEAEEIEAYRGLFWRAPWLGAAFSLMLLSLAGLPLTGGFMGKFYLAAAGIRSGFWLPVMALMVSSAIGLFYYLRVVVAMYSPVAQEADVKTEAFSGGRALSAGIFVVLLALALLILWFGLCPPSLDHLVEWATRGLMASGMR
jgi:NADH-quinone oxidoreductase subunit N